MFLVKWGKLRDVNTMGFLFSLPTWLSWIIVFGQIVIIIFLFKKAIEQKNRNDIWGLIKDILGILLTIITLYPTLPITKYIFPFAPVEYKPTPYVEGYYYGFWHDGMPQGYGRLTYYGFADGQYYSLNVEGQSYKALYYEGEFNRGSRCGEGVVVYESGFKDEGIFNGPWADGVIVFQGKRWFINDTYNGYFDVVVTATSGITADTDYGEWHSVDIEE